MSFTVLSKASLPATSSPYHHLNVAKDIKGINEIIAESGLNEEDSAKLVNHISNLTKTCVADTVDKLS